MHLGRLGFTGKRSGTRKERKGGPGKGRSPQYHSGTWSGEDGRIWGVVGYSLPSEDFLPVSNVSSSPSLVLVVLWGDRGEGGGESQNVR